MKNSFTRWQSITINQLTYAINLILALSIAALAFQVTTLLNPQFNPISWQKCAFALSLLSLMFSTAFGIWCVINRLSDFRLTAKIARMKEQKMSNIELQPYRDLSKNLGNKTWLLFLFQITTFGLGTLLLVIGVTGSLIEKLI